MATCESVRGTDYFLTFGRWNPRHHVQERRCGGRKGEQTGFPSGDGLHPWGTTNALVRHQRWTQVLHNLRKRQRTEARTDVDSLVHRVVQMMGSAATGGPASPDIGMDSATFTDAVRATLNAERFGNIDEMVVATSIVQVLESARQQSWGFGGFWAGARDLPPSGCILSQAAPEVLEQF